jgi:hypothetical protein
LWKIGAGIGVKVMPVPLAATFMDVVFNRTLRISNKIIGIDTIFLLLIILLPSPPF